MIKKINNYFKLDTKNSSYIIFITKFNHVVCNYYGNYIFDAGDLFFTNEKYNAQTGTSVNYSEEDYNYVLYNLSLDWVYDSSPPNDTQIYALSSLN